MLLIGGVPSKLLLLAWSRKICPLQKNFGLATPLSCRLQYCRLEQAKPGMSFSDEVRARNCLLRLLAGSTWGAHASVLRTSALVLVYSAAKYAATVLQPLRWRCVKCVIHHERDVREEKHCIHVTWCEQAIIEWSRWSDPGEWPLIMLVNLVNSWLYVLLAATVRSFAHMPLGISDCNTSLVSQHPH